MFKRGDKIELEITDFAFGGRGISKIDNDTQRTLVFVPNTFPGQKVKVTISAKKKKHYEAKLIDIIERSPKEKINEYQPISGAPYIYVPIKEQEKLKKLTTIFNRLLTGFIMENQLKKFMMPHMKLKSKSLAYLLH